MGEKIRNRFRIVWTFVIFKKQHKKNRKKEKKKEPNTGVEPATLRLRVSRSDQLS